MGGRERQLSLRPDLSATMGSWEYVSKTSLTPVALSELTLRNTLSSQTEGAPARDHIDGGSAFSSERVGVFYNIGIH